MRGKSFKKVQKDASKFYREWKIYGSICPAFNEKIYVQNLGWGHLYSPKHTRREIYSRLQLLPKAREIIEKTTTFQNITYREKKKFYILEAIITQSDGKNIVNKIVRIVLIENRKGKKSFLSVMSKKSG